MSVEDIWLSHDLYPDRDVRIGRETYRHRRCHRCNRNFIMAECSVEWIAVYVSAFRFVPLSRQTDRKWLAEPCPGTPDTNSLTIKA
jgi:hypothetical protein